MSFLYINYFLLDINIERAMKLNILEKLVSIIKHSESEKTKAAALSTIRSLIYENGNF